MEPLVPRELISIEKHLTVDHLYQTRVLHHFKGLEDGLLEHDDSVVPLNNDLEVVADLSVVHGGHVDPLLLKSIYLIRVALELLLHLIQVLFFHLEHLVAHEHVLLPLLLELASQIQLVIDPWLFDRQMSG